MDYSNETDISFNKLYKLHTGGALYQSDSDSWESISSNSYFENYKPPLYTYEEIQANMAGIEPAMQSLVSLNVTDPNSSSKTLKTDSLSELIVKKELDKLVLPDSCILCNVAKCSDHNIALHKTGRPHKSRVEQYIKERLQKLQNKEISKETYKNSAIQTSSSTSNTHVFSSLASNTIKPLEKPVKLIIEEENEQKLKNLMLPHYCWVCMADLEQPINAISHYKSFRHKNNVKEWKLANSPVEISNYIILDQMASDYCYICYASLPQQAQAQSHYNSKRHQNKYNAWISAERQRLQLSKTEAVRETVKEVQPVKVQNHSNNTVCKVCEINVTGLENHCQTKTHRSLAEAFCFVCNIKTMSKEQLAEHVRGARHKKNVKDKDKLNNNLLIPKKIVTPSIKNGTKSISKANTRTVQNNNILPQIKIKNKAEEAKNLQKKLQSETDKFMQVLKSIPPSRALRFLQKSIQELKS